jgi:hypothetical protein
MQTQFFVHDTQGTHAIQRYDVSPFLKSLKPEQLRKYCNVGNRIKAIKLSNGDYRLEEDGTIKGGGPWLATAIAVVGFPTVGVAAFATLITTIPSGPGAFAAAGAVALGGCAAVTKAVIVASVTPTP